MATKPWHAVAPRLVAPNPCLTPGLTTRKTPGVAGKMGRGYELQDT